MSGQKHFHLNVNYPNPVLQPVPESISPTEDCRINIQVADGWAITGHYKNNVLQTITLQKTVATTN